MQDIWYVIPVKGLFDPQGVSIHRLRTAALCHWYRLTLVSSKVLRKLPQFPLISAQSFPVEWVKWLLSLCSCVCPLSFLVRSHSLQFGLSASSNLRFILLCVQPLKHTAETHISLPYTFLWSSVTQANILLATKSSKIHFLMCLILSQPSLLHQKKKKNPQKTKKTFLTKFCACFLLTHHICKM